MENNNCFVIGTSMDGANNVSILATSDFEKGLKATEHSKYFAGLDGHIYSRRKKSGKKNYYLGEYYYHRKKEFKYESDYRGKGGKNLLITIKIDGAPTHKYVNRLVCGAHHGFRNKEWKVWNINENPNDNRPENLEWFFGACLFDILSETEFKLWNAKMDSMDASENTRFNDKLKRKYEKSWFAINKNSETRKTFFERELKIEENSKIKRGFKVSTDESRNYK